MLDNSDLCPHGLLRDQCDVCRTAMKIKPQQMINVNRRNIELDGPHVNFPGLDSNVVDRQHFSGRSSLEERIPQLNRPSVVSSEIHTTKMPMTAQRDALLKGTSMDQYEPKSMTTVVDIEKKFLKKK